MKSSNTAFRASLKSDIKNRLKGKAAIVGIGNILRGDDGLGPKLIESLKGRSVNASLFNCGTAPENYIFPILFASCDTVILIDAADIGTRPGDIKVVAPENILNASFSTHNPSPTLLVDFLKTGKEDLNVFAISVQPKTIAFGQPMCEEVRSSLDVLIGIFSEIFI